MNIDFEQLKGLLELVSQNDISELTVESGQDRITVKKPAYPLAAEFTTAPHMMALAGVNPAPSPHSGHPHPLPHEHLPGQPETSPDTRHGQLQTVTAAMELAPQNNFVRITSPMVGIFYRSASPNKPPFVEVGDVVTTGQTICIIEAMKLMNDLPSEVSGRIVEILASNGATVEYGQPLFLVDPET